MRIVKETVQTETTMKLLIPILILLLGSFTLYAQNDADAYRNRHLENQPPKRQYDPFGISPRFRLPHPEQPVLPDSAVHFPGNFLGNDKAFGDLSQNLPMPVAGPRSAFSSDMPVMVPDSSVQYFILQKKLDVVNPLYRSREEER